MTGPANQLACKALVVQNGIVAEIPPDEVVTYAGPGFVWLHADGMGELDAADLPAYVPRMAANALIAHETRPRCDQIADGAFLNLRGRSSEEMSMSDPLASVRIWAVAGRVFSVTRRPLTALDIVVASVETGLIRDPGDLIAEFAAAITADLDPEVADLGDALDDCEADLDADRIFQLRREVTKVRVKAIGYRRFLFPQRAAIESWRHCRLGGCRRMTASI